MPRKRQPPLTPAPQQPPGKPAGKPIPLGTDLALTLPAVRGQPLPVERHLHKHAGDVHASLAAVVGGAARQALATVADADIHQSLADLSPPAGLVAVGTVDYIPEPGERYTLTRLHATGGIGRVWLARDDDLGRDVALKELRPERADNPKVWARFLHEAQITSQLEHPGIVPVYELARRPDDRQPFYIMRFIKGRTLTEAIRDYHHKRATGQAGALEQVALLNAFVAVCHTVAYAHSRGVIHRDLKGQNVVLGDFGEVIVLDWGFAKVVSRANKEAGMTSVVLEQDVEPYQTMQGQVLGTPAYMAPEQAAGQLELIDHRTDVYGLGAVLFELLTGRAPFVGTDVQEVLRCVREEEPPRPRQVCAGVPPALEAVCLRALAKKPADRYASAADLAREVQRWLVDEPVAAYREPLAARLGRWARRHKPHVAVLAAVVLTAVAGLVVSTMWIREERVRHAERERGLEETLAVQRQATEMMETAGYFKHIALAEREVADQKVARADELLEGCREGRRHWEWHYLHRRTHRCVLTLRGFVSGVVAVAYSPDGKQLAAGEDKGTVTIWDATTSQGLHTFREHQGKGAVFRLAYRPPDGRYLAAQCFLETTVHVWDTRNGQKHATLPGHRDGIRSLAYSPDGRYLATASLDKTGSLRIWDAANGDELRPFPALFPLQDVAYSHDGQRIAVCNFLGSDVRSEGLVLVLDATTGKEIYRIRAHTRRPQCVKFSPDGRLLASCGVEDKTVKVWDATTGQPVHDILAHNGEITNVAISPDSKQLASVSFDGTFKIWDLATGRLLRTFHGHSSFVFGVAFSPDGRHLATSSADKTVKVWEITDLETKTGPEALGLPGHSAGVQSVAFSPDGQRFATAGADKTLRIWDARTGKEIHSLRGDTGAVVSVAFHPQGKHLASAASDGTVKVWDATTGLETRSLRLRVVPVGNVAFSADGRRLATVSQEKTVHVWDVATGQELLPLRGHRSDIYCVAFNPDGQRLASADAGGLLKLWETTTGQELVTLRAQTSAVRCLAFSADGERLAWVGEDKEVKIWDMTAHRPAAPPGRTAQVDTLKLNGHTAAVTAVTFSPDGRRVVSAGEDQTVRVWDTLTGYEALTLRGHTAGVRGVAFSPDGWLLVSAGADGMVKVWDGTPLDAEPAQACSLPAHSR